MIHVSTVQGKSGEYASTADNSRLYCSCPAATYRPRQDCKHIKQYKKDHPDWEGSLDPGSPDDYAMEQMDQDIEAWKDEM
jgi:hypothetical protein